MTNENRLTKEEMRVQAKAQIEELMARMTEQAVANVDKALFSGACPDDWYEEGKYLLAKAIIDSLCVDRPARAGDKQYQKDFANLHLFL